MDPVISNTTIVKTGFLHKRSKYLKIWKKRFIVLTNKNIFAFTGEERESDCTMNLVISSCGKVELCDEALNKDYTFSVEDDQRTYYFQAESQEDRNEWIDAIQQEISNPAVFDESF